MLIYDYRRIFKLGDLSNCEGFHDGYSTWRQYYKPSNLPDDRALCVYLFIINDLFQCPQQWWTTHTCALECLVRTVLHTTIVDRMRFSLLIVQWNWAWSFDSLGLHPLSEIIYTQHTQREREKVIHFNLGFCPYINSTVVYIRMR